MEINFKYGKNIGNGEAVIWYIGHSGWAVKTQKHLLIFDYYEDKREEKSLPLSEGYINPESMGGENVFIFSSHKHHDHFSHVIYEWNREAENINYILGWNKDNGKNPGFFYIPPYSEAGIKDISVTTTNSTDEGVAFLVKVDGLIIFHAGDNADWGDDPKEMYTREIDFIRDKKADIDLAFIPVSTGRGIMIKPVTEGAIYAAKELKPSAMFPMHAGGKEANYEEFAKNAFNHNVKARIFCAKQAGDRFEYPI